ncbi:MAG: PIN domain-containing protein, partial [Acidobacteria bacterium]|nr:PIN domain-containing protein [Acidobacteriota bacterium]
ALTVDSHVHHSASRQWLSSLDVDCRLCFCRATQMSLLCLLTIEAVMGRNVLSQREAWNKYDEWVADERVFLHEEPPGIDSHFRAVTNQSQPAPKEWADAYLAAFASAANLILVSFDRGFRGRTSKFHLLSN